MMALLVTKVSVCLLQVHWTEYIILDANYLLFMQSTKFTTIDPPSPPQNVTYSIESYSICDYTVRIQWEAPSDQGGVEVSNYVVNIAALGMMSKALYTTEPFVTSFLYNYEHDVSISAENCNGAGEIASISFAKGEAVIKL